MKRFSTTSRCFRCVLTTLALFALLFLPSRPAFSSDEGHNNRNEPAEAKEQQGQSLNHDHNHGHDHGQNGGLRPALPQNNPSPEELAQRARQREEALEKAQEIYRSMKLDPALSSLGLGFDHNGQVFDMGMTLEQALIRVLAGGNRCRVKTAPDGEGDCKLDIITKDKRLMSLKMQPKGDKLLIRSMNLSKLDGDGGIEQSGAKAAFYLMTFMHSR